MLLLLPVEDVVGGAPGFGVGGVDSARWVGIQHEQAPIDQVFLPTCRLKEIYHGTSRDRLPAFPQGGVMFDG
jgi:hypothetical protein